MSTYVIASIIENVGYFLLDISIIDFSLFNSFFFLCIKLYIIRVFSSIGRIAVDCNPYYLLAFCIKLCSLVDIRILKTFG